jgi:hypothetical protein
VVALSRMPTACESTDEDEERDTSHSARLYTNRPAINHRSLAGVFQRDRGGGGGVTAGRNVPS